MQSIKYLYFDTKFCILSEQKHVSESASVLNLQL